MGIEDFLTKRQEILGLPLGPKEMDWGRAGIAAAGAAGLAALLSQTPKVVNAAAGVAKKPLEALKKPAEKGADAASDLGETVSETVSGLGDKLEKPVEQAKEMLHNPIEQAKNLFSGDLDLGDKLSSLTGMLGGGDLASKISDLVSGNDGGSDGRRSKKMRPIIQESIDVAVPRSLAYNQWTQMEDLSDALKAVKSVDQDDDATTSWTVKIGPSTREWEAEILEQIPDERIVWKSTSGADVTGVVTFHELAEKLTRVQVEMEYHPSGAVEQVGNLFLAPRKRTRRALKLFKHYLELEADTTGAWRGEIDEGEVVTSDEEAREQEAERAEEQERAESEEQERAKSEDSPEAEDRAEAEAEEDTDAEDSDEETIDLDDASREELYEKAKELNIEGRSSMSKDELAEAVSEHSN
jgi:uncharacterized membrane protein